MSSKGNDIRISTKADEAGEWKEIGTADSLEIEPERGIYISSNPDNTPEKHWISREDLKGLVDEDTFMHIMAGEEVSMEMTGGVDWGTEGGDKTVVISGGPRKGIDEYLGMPAEFLEAIKKVDAQPPAPRNRAERRKQQRDEARQHARSAGQTQKKRR